MEITKTISGAMESIPNLTHNSREHIPPNSVEERRYRNVYFDDDGIGLKEVYDKLFEKSYQEWREKQIEVTDVRGIIMKKLNKTNKRI